MRILFITLLSVFIFSSCQYIMGERVHGNGHITSQQRNVGSFEGVSCSGSMDIRVTQSSTSSVKIETDENLMGLIDVYVDRGTLVVKSRQGFNLDPSRNITVYVSGPLFKAINLSGSGSIVSDNVVSGTEPLEMHVSGSGDINMNVNLPKISAHISGSGNVVLKGQAGDLDISMSGSGNSKCFDLISDHVSIDISGSSDAEVTANKTLDIRMSGSGSVRYKGNASVNQRVSGSGDVQKVG